MAVILRMFSQAVCCSEPDPPLCVLALERFLANDLQAEQSVSSAEDDTAAEGTIIMTRDSDE
jgi:hypothetical protein